MSINSALNAGTMGLLANSGALAAISDNIANVNTTGYKRVQTNFDPLVDARTRASTFAAGGVIGAQRQLITQQGLLSASASATDIGISGPGFFVVSPEASDTTPNSPVLFSRSGSFAPDAAGNLLNSGGYYLKGWPVQADGTINSNPSDITLLETVNISATGGSAEATDRLQYNANLEASAPVRPEVAAGTYDPANSALNMANYDPVAGTGVQPNFTTSTQIFDSKGSLRTINFAFLRKDPTVSPNEWFVEVSMLDATDVVTGASVPAKVDGQIFTGSIAFTTNGAFDAANSTLPAQITFTGSDTVPGANQVGWAPALGIAEQTIALDFGGPSSAGGLSQLDAPSVLLSSNVNGSVFGSLTGVEVDDEGFVQAKFDNGVIKTIYQIPLANFTNPNGLSTVAGGAFRVSATSGGFTFQEAGTGGTGTLSSNSLEASNVDLAAEFTGLITTQRAYSAASKIVTTADEMLEELIRIKR